MLKSPRPSRRRLLVFYLCVYDVLGVEVEFRASEHIHIDVLDESLGLGRFKGTGDARELKDDGAWEEARARQQLYDKRHDRCGHGSIVPLEPCDVD